MYVVFFLLLETGKPPLATATPGCTRQCAFNLVFCGTGKMSALTERRTHRSQKKTEVVRVQLCHYLGLFIYLPLYPPPDLVLGKKILFKFDVHRSPFFLLFFSQNTEYEYEVSMPASVDIGSRVTGVTWYEVHTARKADGKGTLVGTACTVPFRSFSPSPPSPHC